MQSRLPKVLHPCADLPLLCHVVRLARAQGCSPIVVVVSPTTEKAIKAQLAQEFDADVGLRFAVQQAPQGTGDAARAGLGALPDFAGRLYILYGDVPLLTQPTLASLADPQLTAPLSFLTASLAQPLGYGRVVRDSQGDPVAIVEERDCTPAQRALQEVNAGIYLAHTEVLRPALAQLKPANAQQEYYLTDVVAYAAAHGGAQSVLLQDADEVRGVNSRAELVAAEQILVRRLIAAHSAAGVTFRDPAGTFVGVDVQLGRDVEVGMGVQLRGRTTLGEGCRVAGPTVLLDTEVGAEVQIQAFSHLQGAKVGTAAVVGPYARLRPGAQLGESVHVGNFVEVKNSRLGRGAKANHLTYLGDADVGAGTNVGAGTITCNYDGFAKHRTVIGEKAFIGSHATLVAPLRIGDGAFVAAGSVLTQSVPNDALGIGRAAQINKEHYAEKLRARMAAAAAKKEKDQT